MEADTGELIIQECVTHSRFYDRFLLDCAARHGTQERVLEDLASTTSATIVELQQRLCASRWMRATDKCSAIRSWPPAENWRLGR